MPNTLENREKPDQPSQEAGKPKPAAVLRARPVKGKIDHPSLTRQIIARFPKILAALAK
jgi:hypothetical protein